MVSDQKKKKVEILRNLMLKYKVISLGDINALPSKQFQNIRKKLKNKVIIQVTKKRLIKNAIESLKEKDLKPLEKYLENIMPVLLFTNEDPFRLYKLLKKSKSKATAKPGQIAPNDLIIEAGPTSFTPGPIIGELGQLGIVATVENGKIVIKKDKVLVKEGEVIDDKRSSMLSKMGIEPMEIGLNIKVVYDDGTLYEKSVLDFDEEKLVNDMKIAHQNAISLALKVGYTTKETIKLLMGKASSQAKALGSILNPKIESALSKGRDAEKNIKKADYKEDSAQAKELLDKIKDQGEVKKFKEPETKPSPIKPEDLVKEE